MSESDAIITLTSDFGYQDYYVSAMKAVILGISPNARLIDITHAVPPQDIMAGAWTLRNTAFLYPEKTIHLAVIDPGVGTNRKPVIVKLNNHFFVGPDNGLFSLLCETGNAEAFEIRDQKFMRDTISSTFHGRDIFAPCAAYLANGVSPESFGPKIENLFTYRWAEPISDKEGIQGWIIHIDVYGNLITNIPATLLKGRHNGLKIYAGTSIMNSIVQTYGEAEPGDAITYPGSSGMLEIAVNMGNAAELLNITKGAPVSIVFKK
jgi:S-adenosylmethionine hydrolase